MTSTQYTTDIYLVITPAAVGEFTLAIIDYSKPLMERMVVKRTYCSSEVRATVEALASEHGYSVRGVMWPSDGINQNGYYPLVAA